MRLVLDTAVVVVAMRSLSGGSAELLRQIRLGRATKVISPALALEYEAFCMMDEHRWIAGLSTAEVASFLGRIIELAEPVKMYVRWRPQLPDSGDEFVLDAAVNGRASAIVTFNVRDLRNAWPSFGMEVIRPGEALRRIRSSRQA